VKEWEEKGKESTWQQQALQTLTFDWESIQSVSFLRLWASKHGFPTLAAVQLLCMLPQLVSASVTGQFGAR